MTHDDGFIQFRQAWNRAGLREGLAALVRRSGFRFIGLFRLNDGQVEPLLQFDRDSPGVCAPDPVATIAARGCFVRDDQGALRSADEAGAQAQPPVAACPAAGATPPVRSRGKVWVDGQRAFWSVPVIDPEGTLLASLCLYDLLPHDAQAVDVELMLRAAAAIAHSGALSENGLAEPALA